MRFCLIFTLLGLVLLIAGGFLLYTVFLDTPETIAKEDATFDLATASAQPPINTDPNGFSSAAGQGGFAQGIVEVRRIEFEYPEMFRDGESGTIRLRFTKGSVSSTPDAEGNVVEIDTTAFTTYYATHDGQITATIGAPDFEIEPDDSISFPLIDGQDSEWEWTLKPKKTGSFGISVLVTVSWRPKIDGVASIPETTVWVNSVDVEVNQVLGIISIPNASIAGTVLAVLGVVAQSQNILDILKFFLGVRGDRGRDNRRNSRYDEEEDNRRGRNNRNRNTRRR